MNTTFTIVNPITAEVFCCSGTQPSLVLRQIYKIAHQWQRYWQHYRPLYNLAIYRGEISQTSVPAYICRLDGDLIYVEQFYILGKDRRVR